MRRVLELKTGDIKRKGKKDRKATLELLAYCVSHLPAHFVPVKLDLHDRRVGREHCQNCLGPFRTDAVPAEVQNLQCAIGR